MPVAAPAKARIGKTMVAGYFSPEMARAVKLLAVERGVTVQALIGEALDLVLRQAGGSLQQGKFVIALHQGGKVVQRGGQGVGQRHMVGFVRDASVRVKWLV